MEENYDKDDTFLGRWISGELSAEELIEFKKTETYKQFKLINEESQQLSSPDIDVEAALLSVKEKLKPKSSKLKTIRLWQTIAAAAAILIISLGFFINSSKTYSNGIGEVQTIVLDDGSKINLNAKSSVSLKRFFWSNNRVVNLKGEAYFAVNKGEDFKVETSKGTVKVLGTEFNIKDRANFELKCYKGKVEFTQRNKISLTKVLTKGMQVNVEGNDINDVTFSESTPSWRKGFTRFDERPLHEVLEELSYYFDVKFDTEKIDTNRLYSGSFEHKNIDLALKATLVPMGITYKLEQDVYVLSE
ncbi:FecR family protein [Winogradskyella flava]|uniref:FecR family protein n=1 Tax=Winogradskyella flava TaxID=1884876 RepID=UPI0024907780|nr:FecR domain-containing protein [Winogradskyella flava]